ncbi:MAG: protein kinase, partial [Deltaproteobacteria bacterium]|nr:protein kinase [Deltaproteobacteria bacterium]
MAELIRGAETTYEVIRPLGKGGMGQVLLVKSPRHPQPVALKFLQSQLMTEARIAGFKREFALLSELKHPHLCRAYDFGYAPSHELYFFTSEFVEGEELYRALGNATLQEAELVITQILSALDFLHTAGLVHFDVKGENVLVTRNGRLTAKLVDLGVTSPVNRPLTEIAGSLNYIAPELLLPHPQADGRCDLYSFGVLCYMLLAGQLPYSLHAFEDVWHWHRQHPHLDLEPLQRRGVPDYLCEMIARLMRPTPSERYSSAGVALNYLSLHAGTSQMERRIQQRAQMSEGPFVGRGAAMLALKKAFKHPPRAVLITGAAGMGKTRIVNELKYAAQLADYSVIVIDGHEAGRSWEIFSQAMGWNETVQTAEAGAGWVQAHAREHPLCLCIDNFSAAAHGVQQCCSQMMAACYSAALASDTIPLLIVATGEPDAVPKNVTGVTTMELSPLDEGEVQQFLQQLVGTPDDFAAYAQAVWNFSRGIPLLMIEAAHAYHQQAALPESVEDLYLNQLAGLSPTGRALIELLAYAGRPVPFAVLQRETEEAATLVGGLTAAMLVRHDRQTDRYTVATGALAAVVLGAIAPKAKKRFARQLVEWLAGEPGVTAMDLAPFAPALPDHARAVAILGEAARMAEATGQTGRAIGILRDLVDVHTAQDAGTEALATRRKIATLQLYQGTYDACEATVNAIVRKLGSPGVEELKLLGLLCRVRRKPKEAIAYYDRALAFGANDDGDPTRLFLQNERGQAFLEAGDTAQAIALLTETHA